MQATTLLLPPLLALAAAPASAQIELLDLEPASPPSAALDHFGADVAPVGDVDGDGIQDFAVVVERGFFGSKGHVQVTSGATRRPLATLFPDVTNTTGMVAAGLGDVDADGFPDLAAGARYDDALVSDRGKVVVYSGRTLDVHRTHVGATGGVELGASIAGMPDATFDGHADYLVGMPGAWLILSSSVVGGVRLYSGLDGTIEETFWGPSVGSRFGETVVGIGDAHFDLLEYSWAVGAPAIDQVRVYYGFDPSSAHQLTLTGGSGTGFGKAISGMDDLDGDGLNEVAVGAPDAVILGPFGSQIGSGRVAVFDAVSGAVLRESFGGIDERRGTSLADAGDLDGDGVGELLVGGDDAAYVYDDDWSGGPELLEFALPGAGPANVAALDLGTLFTPLPTAAFGFPGAEAPDLDAGEVQLRRLGLDPAGTLYERMTSRSHARFGASVALVDDFDLDGTPDLAVGIPFDDRGGAEAGAVEVRSGATGAVLHAILGEPGSQLGAAVARVEDADGDGRDDLAAGAPRATDDGLFLPDPVGAVTVYSAAGATAISTSLGTEANGRYGAAVASAGDFDGDGAGDVLVGEPWASPPSGLPIPVERNGQAHVASGASPGSIVWSESVDEPDANFGTAVANAGDVDGDGRDDLAISAPGRQILGGGVDHGSVEVYSAATGAPVWYFPGEQEQERLGAALAAIGDADGDGVSDLAVGSPGWDLDGSGSGSNYGRVRVLSGADGTLIGPINGSEGERLGAAVAAAGDVDQDGKPDVAAGAPSYVSLGTFQVIGRVRVFDADEATVLRAFVGSTPVSPIGAALAGGTDVDGDGDLELLAGAPAYSDASAEVGGARLLSTHAEGTVDFGTGTAGCAGPHQLGLAAAAEVGGVADFRCDGIAPGLAPTLVLSTAPDVAGSDPLGLGALLHVDLLGLFATIALPPTAGDAPIAAPVGVPAEPALAGFTLHAQVGLFWSGGCGVVPGGFSSSTGLTVTIQP